MAHTGRAVPRVDYYQDSYYVGMTNEFIKKQQELARVKLNKSYLRLAYGKSDIQTTKKEVNETIQQIITNTGEELLGRLEDNYVVVLDDKGEETEVVTLDTIKQHITNLTGVE